MDETGRGRRASARRGRIWLLRGVLVAVALTLSLVGIEVFLRTADPIGLNYEREHQRYREQALRYAWSDLPPARFGEIDLDGTLYRHLPNLRVDLGSYTLRTNSLGFRGPEIAREKPPGTFRIVVLGDSVSYGTGVDEEVTFLRRWETSLEQRHPGRAFEVVNTGHPMYDTVQELALLRDEALALQPDLVLLVYVVNDVEPTRDVVEQALLGMPPREGEALADPGDFWTALAGVVRPVLPATAKLIELQSDPAARFLSTLPPGVEYAPERFGKGPRGWQRSREALLAIRDLCAAAGVPFVLLDHTIPALQALPGFCREHGIAYHPFRFSQQEMDLPIRNSRLDSHSNARGHELLLQKLEALEPELPLPR